MLTIERLNNSHIEGVLEVSIADEQLQFAGTPDEFIQDGSDTAHLHVFKLNQRIIGFCKLDIAYATSYDFCPEGGIGLRFFVIDKSQQGKGLGTRAVKVLREYIKQHYPQFNAIYLSVNCQNPAARACYLKAGFNESEALYLAGPSGPQHIMYSNLD